jgi:hypothetical protein
VATDRAATASTKPAILGFGSVRWRAADASAVPPIWMNYGWDAREGDALEEPRRRNVKYSSRIIKAGALVADTKTFLSHWDIKSSIQANVDRIRRENIFGKASHSRVADVLAIFRQRYLLEEDVTRALVALVKSHFPAASLDRILYFHSARSPSQAATCPQNDFACRFPEHRSVEPTAAPNDNSTLQRRRFETSGCPEMRKS